MKKHMIKQVISLFICISLCFTVVYPVPAKASTTEIIKISDETFHNSVPKISVVTADGNGSTLEKSDGYVDAHITITDTDGTELSDDVSFKVRGNTTALYWINKKSFTFKFAKKKDVLGMGKGKKWAIVANAFDPTLLRNYLAFETADELEIPYTSMHKFVELWLDGSFRGNYVLFEPVQQGADRVDIDIESNGGMKDFLVEYETETAMVNPSDTYFKAANVRFIATDPDEPSEDQISYMQNVLSDIITTLQSGSEEQIREIIDTSSFAKYYLLNEYFKTFDFSVTSVFFYYKDGKLFAGPPWDYDLSMGNTNSELAGRCREANSSSGIFADKNLFAYIARKSWFKEIVKQEYEAHYDYFSHIHTDGGILDTMHLTYRGTIDRNYSEAGWRASKWWINIQRQPDKTYDENYAFLKNWLAERYNWFEEYLEPFYREYIIGDTDGNGEIDICDVTQIQRFLIGFYYDQDYSVRGNVTGDELSIVDATEIQRYLIGLKNSLCIGEKNKAKFAN